MSGLSSARIAELRAAIEEGHREAEELFWERLRDEGTPIVEPIAGDGTSVLVTFVWRGDADTRGVVIVGGIPGYRFPQLERLSATDVWYMTARVPLGVRTTYRFLENPSWLGRDVLTLSPDEFRNTESEAWAADPLNALRFERPLLPAASVVELGDAGEQPWIVEHEDVAHGRVEPHRWVSESLESARIVWTYLPPGYDETTATFPLVVLFDGYMYLQMDVRQTVDNLIAAERVKPAIVAMVHSVDRLQELSCNARFTTAVADELIGHWLPSRYRLARPTIVGGLSLGGLAAAFSALWRPDVFRGGVISQSGSYWWGPGASIPARMSDRSVHWEWLIDQYERSSAPPTRWYMDVGNLEVARPGDDGPDMVNVNRRMRDVLRAKGHEVEYAEFSGAHDMICWRGTLANALQTLLPARDA